MGTQDVTRFSYDRAKRYDGVRMQQGRVIRDSEWNESETISSEDRRLTRLHTIGPAGSPDDGYRVANAAVTGGFLDFDILPGTFYLGGQRLRLAHTDTYRLQNDWLTFPHGSSPVGADGEYDFAYLEILQQVVAETEDGELTEIALGGPDTSTRTRLVARVRTFRGAGPADCHDAWAAYVGFLAQAGTVGADYAVEPDGRAQISLNALGSTGDLCSPPVQGGYLHAENQTLRIEIVGAHRFSWSFDNASPLYRVTVEPDLRTLKFLSPRPRDEAHWPLADQVVEVLEWGALLSNGQKLAEISGVFRRLQQGYDPDDGSIRLSSALPATLGQNWQQRSDSAAIQGADPPFYYLRVWNRGADTGAQPRIPFQAGLPVPLGTTGLSVTFTGAQFLRGDHWIVAGRPDHPKRVLPWDILLRPLPPHGYRRHVAPLALIRWSGGSPQVVEDCRPRFDPLTRQRRCCRFTVGDGSRSHGDFTSIQAAVDALPPRGGEICVLEGEFEGAVRIRDARDVIIHGCGSRSILRLSPADQPTDPIVAIERSLRVKLHGLTIEALQGVGVEAFDEVVGLTLESLDVRARDRSAISVRDVNDLRISGCRVRAALLAAPLSSRSDAGHWPGVYAQGIGLRITGNEIRAAGAADRQTTGLGGLQIGGSSERVLIRDNRIEEGNGNGITLGSVAYVRRENLGASGVTRRLFNNALRLPGHGWIHVARDGCLELPPFPTDPPPPGGGPPLVPISEGPLADVRIVDNGIYEMGGNGIGVARFFAMRSVRVREMILTDRLSIEKNRIRGCLQLHPGEPPPTATAWVGFGGVALAGGSEISIRQNQIERNGRSHHDAVCGVFVLHATGLVVEANRILSNGPRRDEGPAPRRGQRGGIVVGLAVEPALLTGTQRLQLPGFGEGLPAARVHDNVVLSPFGRALSMLALGPVSVQGNRLSARNSGTPDLPAKYAAVYAAGSSGGGALSGSAVAALSQQAFDLVGGSAVHIVHVGTSAGWPTPNLGFGHFGNAAMHSSMNRSVSTGPGDSNPAMAEPSPDIGGMVLVEPHEPIKGLGARGQVSFNDNQVQLDLRDQQPALALCSTLIVASVDVSVQDNQFECLLDQDRLISDAILSGFTLRVSGNSFTETAGRAGFSAWTVGLLNTTMGNQSTHCLRVDAPSPAGVIDLANRSLIELANPFACGRCKDFRTGWEVFSRGTAQSTAEAALMSNLDIRDAGGKTVTARQAQVGALWGLDLGAVTSVGFLRPVDRVSMVLAFADQPPTVKGLDANDAVIASGLPTGRRNTAVSLELTGAGISRLLIDAPSTTILVKICADGAIPELSSVPSNLMWRIIS